MIYLTDELLDQLLVSLREEVNDGSDDDEYYVMTEEQAGLRLARMAGQEPEEDYEECLDDSTSELKELFASLRCSEDLERVYLEADESYSVEEGDRIIVVKKEGSVVLVE